jgi:hypothetical protein
LIVRPDGDKVYVEGVEPYSQVVLMGVIRRVVGTIPGFERWVGTALDDDGDGSVTVTLETEVRPNRSAWVVVDTQTMAFSMSQVVVGGSSVTSPTESTLLAGAPEWPIEAGKVEVLLVRPGSLVGPGTFAPDGARIWAGPVWDGGPLDADGVHNGSVEVQARRLEDVSGSSLPPPETFEAGDLLVAFEPEAFYSFVARVGSGGGQ